MARAPKLSPEAREQFAALADFLMPAHGRMPAASAVDVAGDLLDEVLGFRPDIAEAFHRGLGAIAGRSPADAANRLFKSDEEAFNALSLVVSAAYYMAPEVRSALGYPGQESVAYDPHAVPEYLTNGLLERVLLRGTIYKPTPR